MRTVEGTRFIPQISYTVVQFAYIIYICEQRVIMTVNSYILLVLIISYDILLDTQKLNACITIPLTYINKSVT